ncbi:MAG TPA: hypothetical protein VGM18_16105 [Candidatus Sulfotelmatobacter sp.]|jgi:hypothetical protein
MAAKKKAAKKKQTKSKKSAAGKLTAKKVAKKTKPANKRATAKTTPAKIARAKAAPAKVRVKSKKKTAGTSAVARRRSATERVRENRTFRPERERAITGGQSGDLQGLSDTEGANSESVDELVEEGNAFEADAVQGVEDADNADEREVHTHEVPEDDVPEEYIDKE